MLDRPPSLLTLRFKPLKRLATDASNDVLDEGPDYGAALASGIAQAFGNNTTVKGPPLKKRRCVGSPTNDDVIDISDSNPESPHVSAQKTSQTESVPQSTAQDKEKTAGQAGG